MKLQYIDSACVLIEHKGIKILCDPWLTDGVYYGSWFHYPPLAVSAKDFFDVNGIYLSHIHPDHFDIATLQAFPKHMPIYILEYADKFFLNLIKKIGFETVIEIPHATQIDLGLGFFIGIYASDNCDPELCGRFFNCSFPTPYTKTKQIDSLAVFHADGQVIVNTNDCPYAMASAVCDAIVDKFKQIDLLLVGYRAAGPYPQCFDNLSDAEKCVESKKISEKFLTFALEYIKHLRPKYFLPFAGQYVLGGKLASLNQYLSPNIDELPLLFPPKLTQQHVNSEMVLLNNLESFDLDLRIASKSFVPLPASERNDYIENVLKSKKLAYEEDANPSLEELIQKVSWAHAKLIAHQKFYKFETNWHVYLDFGYQQYFLIPFAENENISLISPSQMIEPYLKVRLDARLLLRILDRKAHWNNAEIGSHLHFARYPNQHNRTIHYLMSYFHC